MSTSTRPPDTRTTTPPDVDQLIPTQRSAQHRPGTRDRTPPGPRVWLVAGNGRPDPRDRPAVRDDWLRVWWPGEDDLWHTADGYRHATWAELRIRYDLVEVFGA